MYLCTNIYYRMIICLYIQSLAAGLDSKVFRLSTLRPTITLTKLKLESNFKLQPVINYKLMYVCFFFMFVCKVYLKFNLN